MQVLPRSYNVSVDPQKLYQFLLASQQNCYNNCTQIVSISVGIEPLDPLAVLERIAQPNQLSFYFENKEQGEAIAAIDAVAQLRLSGNNRFNVAQNFIKSCLDYTSLFSTIIHPFAGPHFFCSFSFFDQIAQPDYPFPAGTIFLPRWQIARMGDRACLVANLSITANMDLKGVVQQLLHDIQFITLSEKFFPEFPHLSHKLFKEDVTSVDLFKQSVVDSSKLIKANHLNKIVLAHAIDVKASNTFNIFQCLNNLRMLHPGCYVFSTSNGKGQNFIGASPERLISIHAQQLSTDALAGSTSRGKTVVEDIKLANLLLHSEKDRREHQVVIDFICDRLDELGIVPQLLPPRLRRLANIQHLWTPIQAKVPSIVHPLEIVAALHPTPAVAGNSRNVACDRIRCYEKFERGLYAAPLGWVNHKGNSEFIVGIRSALIDGDRARLYAGAGIVAGSDPDRELAEVQLKLQALLKALV
jgi:menaquinone-specific isochorismate synthase